MSNTPDPPQAEVGCLAGVPRLQKRVKDTFGQLGCLPEDIYEGKMTVLSVSRRKTMGMGRKGGPFR